MTISQSIKLISLFISISLSTFAQVTDTLDLVWSEEFEGNGLDNSKWAACPEWHRQGGSYWEADNDQLDVSVLSSGVYILNVGNEGIKIIKR